MKKTSLLLVMVLGMLMVGKAEAEGAWVLWWRTNLLSDFTWERMDAFTSCERCKQQQRVECEHLLTPIKGIGKINGCPSYVTYIFSNGSIAESNFICLPESVDPRK